MITQCEAIIEAFKELGGVQTHQEIANWVNKKYGPKWKDFSTPLADMVPVAKGGNKSSTVPDYFRVLERVERGKYRLLNDDI
ncbi:hypothetical protein DS745_21430 [Anaerobacillus alkaliphilus]|uniref:HTH HARE-type domain-containing protein n=1 Tax=Anaerobacillus alkaliphilus TaxID=1548597 RepID=A0A4Q0VPN4_9BACI|nr:hypothetical protein [Anaerobacillus alkaliphilus]RXI96295.1 hypothetical protein DS745_21430 [Anaerobacillus alkaliphilus]